MAKVCGVCGNKIKLLDQNLKVADGYLCENCYTKIGLASKVGPSMAAMTWGESHTIAEISNLIDAGVTVDPKQAVQASKDAANAEKNEKMEKIKKQFEEVGVSDLWGTKKELNALPDILSDSEVVKYATSGFIDNNTVLIVCTDVRILFIDKGMLYGVKSTEIPLDMVNSVNYSKKLLFGNISIINGAVTTLVENVNKETAPLMVDAIKQARMEFMNKRNNPAPVQTQASPADEIRKFKFLLDDGILTQEEFDAKKKQILGL